MKKKKRNKNRITMSFSKIEDLNDLPKVLRDAIAEMTADEDEALTCSAPPDQVRKMRECLSTMIIEGDPGSKKIPDGHLLFHCAEGLKVLAHWKEHGCGSEEEIEIATAIAGQTLQWIYDRGIISEPIQKESV